MDTVEKASYQANFWCSYAPPWCGQQPPAAKQSDASRPLALILALAWEQGADLG